MKKALFAFLTCLLLASLPIIRLEAATVSGASLVSYFDDTNHVNQALTGEYGSVISIEPPTNSGYTFAFWVINGVVRDDLSASDHLYLTDNLEVKAIYAPDGQYAALFMDANEHLLKVDYFDPLQSEPADVVVPPDVESLPTKPGYDVASSPWGTVNFTSVSAHTVYTLQYSPRSDWSSRNFTITVVNGSGSGSYLYNTVVTAVADAAPDGQYFAGWIDDNEDIISYDATYTFTALSSHMIEATYSTEAPTYLYSLGFQSLTLRVGYLSYLSQFGTVAGAEMVEWGIITSPYYEVDNSFDLESSWATKYRSNIYNVETNEYVISIPQDAYVAARAYATYLYDEGLVTIYSGIQTYIGNSQVYVSADYGTAETYATATGAGWTDSGGWTTAYLPLDVAGEYFQSPSFNAITGQLIFSINAWASSAGSSNTFKIEAYNEANELLETSGNITLSSAGMTSVYNNYQYKFANVAKAIKYIKFTYNKEVTGINMRIASVAIEEGAPKRPESISVSGSSQYLATGSTMQLTATASPQGTIGTVSWSSSASSIASISSSGLVTGESAGSATIYATSTIDNTVVGSYTITVQTPLAIEVSVSGGNGSVTPTSASVLPGSNLILTLTPDSGYTSDTITINGGSPIDLVGETTFQISNITENQTVVVTFMSGIQENVVSQVLTGTTGNPPSGWTYSGLGSAYADGSLKMDSTGDYIITCTIALQTSATFYITLKGNSFLGGSLVFYDQNNNVLHTFTTEIVNSQVVLSFTITDTSVTSVKFVYTKSAGNLGIYKVEIKHILE